jgi:signal transduction histidine kinase
LFVSATAWTVVILLITGIVLSSLYRQAVERAFDRRLGVYLRTLVADVASPEEPNDKAGPALGEPLFELPLSGWYWQVTRTDPGKNELRASRSLWDGGDAEISDETRSFDQALAITFVLLAAVLLLTTMFQVRFGLAPLKRITDSLAAIRGGTAERLAGQFPVEIEPLARETNALIDANREIVERARTHVGNLAHALKTPLSVMVNEASARGDDPLALKVMEQAAIMRDQVTRHLERARLAARLTVIGTVTDVTPVVTALARTMEKIHRDRAITIEVRADDALRFRGERADLEEMIGNLVDNACKWAASRVTIEVLRERRDAASQDHVLRVDDDGRGLSASEREQAGRRGRRLDETKPGSGLGLSIVVELASLYGGELKLGTAPLGGLRAELVLPAG